MPLPGAGGRPTQSLSVIVMRLPYALKMLLREPGRSLPAMLAVTFSAVLVSMQSGMLLGSHVRRGADDETFLRDRGRERRRLGVEGLPWSGRVPGQVGAELEREVVREVTRRVELLDAAAFDGHGDDQPAIHGAEAPVRGVGLAVEVDRRFDDRRFGAAGLQP